ncbi:MAG: LysR substrate-binding domain-containing protein [Parvibaculum sp.]
MPRHTTPSFAPLPLSGLRVFEACARHRNFTAAAAELSLTTSAISHQIKRLETQMELKLFERTTKGVELTPRGNTFAAEVIQAFDLLRIAQQRLNLDRTVVRLSTVPTFARRFLIQNIRKFEERNPGVELKLEISLRLVNYMTNEADVGVRFGTGDWPGLYAEKLMDVEVRPVCAPHLMGPKGAFVSRNATLISSAASKEAWTLWFNAVHDTPARPKREVWYDALHDTLEAARDGVGIALAPAVFAEHDVAEGLLCFAHPETMVAEASYYLVCRQGEQEAARFRRVRSWLRNCINS